MASVRHAAVLDLIGRRKRRGAASRQVLSRQVLSRQGSVRWGNVATGCAAGGPVTGGSVGVALLAGRGVAVSVRVEGVVVDGVALGLWRGSVRCRGVSSRRGRGGGVGGCGIRWGGCRGSRRWDGGAGGGACRVPAADGRGELVVTAGGASGGRWRWRVCRRCGCRDGCVLLAGGRGGPRGWVSWGRRERAGRGGGGGAARCPGGRIGIDGRPRSVHETPWSRVRRGARSGARQKR